MIRRDREFCIAAGKKIVYCSPEHRPCARSSPLLYFIIIIEVSLMMIIFVTTSFLYKFYLIMQCDHICLFVSNFMDTFWHIFHFCYLIIYKRCSISVALTTQLFEFSFWKFPSVDCQINHVCNKIIKIRHIKFDAYLNENI